MEFPITDLLSPEECEAWIRQYFHPHGLRCPMCSEPVETAYVFRQTRKSQLTVYRCRACWATYNLYSRTIFQQRHLTPRQVVLLIRGFLKGEPSRVLAAELDVSYATSTYGKRFNTTPNNCNPRRP